MMGSYRRETCRRACGTDSGKSSSEIQCVGWQLSSLPWSQLGLVWQGIEESLLEKWTVERQSLHPCRCLESLLRILREQGLSCLCFLVLHGSPLLPVSALGFGPLPDPLLRLQSCFKVIQRFQDVELGTYLRPYWISPLRTGGGGEAYVFEGRIQGL